MNLEIKLVLLATCAGLGVILIGVERFLAAQRRPTWVRPARGLLPLAALGTPVVMGAGVAVKVKPIDGKKRLSASLLIGGFANAGTLASPAQALRSSPADASLSRRPPGVVPG